MLTRTTPSTPSTLVRRHGLVCIGAVALYLGSMQLAVPDPLPRSQLHYRVVIILGYGHLVGALVGGRARRRAAGGHSSPELEWTAGRLAGLSLLFSLYCIGLEQLPALVLPLLVLSTWHSVENEWALRSAYRHAASVPPLSRRPGVQLALLALTALLLGIAGGTLEKGDFGGLLPLALSEVAPSRPLAPLCFGDVFAATTLLHLMGWLVFLLQRAAIQGRDAPRRTIRLLAWTHGPPAAVCATLLALPEALLPTLREAVFSPAIYLFWSTLHVLQTLVSRRRSC